MRAVIQRVTRAKVSINNETRASIEKGLVVLLGIEEADTLEDAEWLSQKIARLRIFDDAQGVMNLPLTEVNGEILSISQFTLFAKTKKGNRPSYIQAAKPETAIPLYNQFNSKLSVEISKEVKTGEFGANMLVELINDGPVTIIIDTKNKE
ncbi:MAG: D-aminoacyl-tRNA deacylase [Bacteroidales bacterium]